MSGFSGGRPKGRGYSHATGVKMTVITKKKQTAEQSRAPSAKASSVGDEDNSLLLKLRHILDDLDSGDYTAKGWGTPKQEPPQGSLNKVEKCLQSLRQHIKKLYMESMQKENAVQAVRNHLIDIKQCVDQDDYEIETPAEAAGKGRNMTSKDNKKKDEEVDEMTKREILKTLSTFSKSYKSLKRLNDEVVKWKQHVCGPRANPNQKQTGQTKSRAGKVPVPVTPKEESGEEALDVLRKKNEISMSGLREKLQIAEEKVSQLYSDMKKLEDQCRGRHPTEGSEGSEQFDEQTCIKSMQGVIEERNRLKQLEEHIFQWERSFHPIENSKPNDPKKHNKNPSNIQKKKHGNQTPVPTTALDRSGEEVIQFIKVELEKEKEKLSEHIQTAERKVTQVYSDMKNIEYQCRGIECTAELDQFDEQKCIEFLQGVMEERNRLKQLEEDIYHWERSFPPIEDNQPNDSKKYNDKPSKDQRREHGNQSPVSSTPMDRSGEKVIHSLKAKVKDEMQKYVEYTEHTEQPEQPEQYDTQKCLNSVLDLLHERKSFREYIKTLQKRQKDNEHELEWKNKEKARLEKEKITMQADFEKDKKHLMLRLSKMAGAKLTDNNPNIADLSDPDRAVKLAERFSEIYDNQWTEAFECLEQHNWKDIEVVRFLYSSLLDAYTFCVNVSDNQMAVLKSNLVCPVSAAIETKGTSEDQPDLSTLHRKALSDLRKENKESSTKDVKKRYLEKKKADGVNGLEFPIVETYITECVDVCWRMTLLSPRVYIEAEDMERQKIVKEKYKLYTKNGSKIDYVVWPALYLHKDGPLLQKGVVQPK